MRTSLLFLGTLSALLGCTSSGPGNNGIDAGSNGGGSNDAGTHIDAPGPGTDGTVGTAAVTIIVEPNGNGASELVSAIAAAQHSVYVTMYEMSDRSVINAIAARAQAGLDVQVILDGSSMNKSFNMSAYSTLSSAGAHPVWSSSAFTYTHEKTIIIDGATAWIMTMNTNTSSPSSNREYLAIDTNAADVAEATAIFKADHAMQSITPSGALVVANTNARSQIVALINSAQHTVDLEGEEFSDTHSGGVVNAIAAAAQRGVTVHVVVATGNIDSVSVSSVKGAGAHVVATGPTSGNGTPSNPYIHAKAVVVDCVSGTCARGFIGSENFSAGSLGYNRELGVIFTTASELAKVKSAIDTDFAHGVAQ